MSSRVWIFAAFGCYLLAMMGIGVFYYKRTKNSEDYFLGGRSLNGWVAALSAQASDMSGWLLMGLMQFFIYVEIISAGLAVFNVFPIPPLDGSKVLFAFLPDRAYMTLMRYEKYGMLVLFVLVWLGVGDNILSEGIYRVYELLVNWIVY